MISQRKPITVFLSQVDVTKDLWAIDGDSGFDEPSNIVLLKMGKYMEKMLTVPAQEFNNYFVLDFLTNKPKMQLSEEQKAAYLQEDYFRYMRSGKMMLRS